MPEVLLQVRPLRFLFEAVDRIEFPDPPGQPIRGALGEALRRNGCTHQCPEIPPNPGDRKCQWRSECPYGRLFDPEATAGPSGLRYPPRPFALQTLSLAGDCFPPGARFSIGLNLFDVRDNRFPSELILAMDSAASAGWNGQRARLLAVQQLDSHGEPACQISQPIRPNAALPDPIILTDAAPLGEVPRIAVQFLSPALLIHKQRPIAVPRFDVLLSRIRDRLSSLATFYGSGPLTIAFKELGARAADIQLSANRTRWVAQQRISRRSGSLQPLDGLVGEAVYQGELAPFVPFLRAAEWSGVGKNTSWGQGAIRYSI